MPAYPPSPPQDKRSLYDKVEKPLKDWAQETAISYTLSEGVRRLAPTAVGGPAGFAIDTGATAMSPTKTSECDGLNLDPIKAYDKGCRIHTLQPQSVPALRHPASDSDEDEDEQ